MTKYPYAFSKRLVLASASPRRKELLKRLTENFAVLPADIDEEKFTGLKPKKLVMTLSREKAKATVSKQEALNKSVLAADTIVVCKGKIYGKPKNFEGSVRMLGELNGRRHSVFTGVTLTNGREYITFSVRSFVKFKKLSKTEIENYIDKCRPFDKAGAYGIQDNQIVKSYRGSYTNIVGLPLEKLKIVLTKAGVLDGGH